MNVVQEDLNIVNHLHGHSREETIVLLLFLLVSLVASFWRVIQRYGGQ